MAAVRRRVAGADLTGGRLMVMVLQSLRGLIQCGIDPHVGAAVIGAVTGENLLRPCEVPTRIMFRNTLVHQHLLLCFLTTGKQQPQQQPQPHTPAPIPVQNIRRMILRVY